MSKETTEILEKIKKTGFSIYEISTKTGIPKSRFYSWTQGRALPKHEDVQKLKLFLASVTIENISEEPEVSYIKQRRDKKNNQTEFRVPLVTVKARAGYVSSYDQIDLVNSLDKYAIPPGVSYVGAIWRYFEVDGDSMEPTLSSGDYVLCSQVPQDDWPNVPDFYVHVMRPEEV